MDSSIRLIRVKHTLSGGRHPIFSSQSCRQERHTQTASYKRGKNCATSNQVHNGGTTRFGNTVQVGGRVQCFDNAAGKFHSRVSFDSSGEFHSRSKFGNTLKFRVQVDNTAEIHSSVKIQSICVEFHSLF
uniref:Uncharacterized protein n=1 Tax=Cacopsylla melanoneura TaxID=428564 RepID=A0A8D8YX15_9HEMI